MTDSANCTFLRPSRRPLLKRGVEPPEFGREIREVTTADADDRRKNLLSIKTGERSVLSIELRAMRQQERGEKKGDASQMIRPRTFPCIAGPAAAYSPHKPLKCLPRTRAYVLSVGLRPPAGP